MIKMVLKRFDRTVELNVPAEYEHVLLCLWRLGLDRDPAKYTISSGSWWTNMEMRRVHLRC